MKRDFQEFVVTQSPLSLFKTLKVWSFSFLLAFEQILDTCLSNFRSLSNVIPRSLISLPSQTKSLSNFPLFVYFYFLILRDDIYRYEVSFNSFQTKQCLAQNCALTSPVLILSLNCKTYGVVSSAKLHISTPFNAKKVSQKILNKT